VYTWGYKMPAPINFLEPDSVLAGDAVVRTERGTWAHFTGRVSTLSAEAPEEVGPVLDLVEQWADGGGVAIGYVAYEAGQGLDPALTLKGSSGPYAQFALFNDAPREFDALAPVAPPKQLTMVPAWTEDEYVVHAEQVLEDIRAGRIYQANLTFPLELDFPDIKSAWFGLAEPSAPPHSVYVEFSNLQIACLSPELFFSRDGNRWRSRPMKGTSSLDAHYASPLQLREKDRAENIMIVDMVRNDLGRIAETGSVQVFSLCDIETYPGLVQMTSTVQANSSAGLREGFRALFPAASITGAPKVEASRVIAEHEVAPRGIYCGAVGTVGPGRNTRFAVGIRTLIRQNKDCFYWVGSGLVADSDPSSEYAECLLKARQLGVVHPFGFVETMRLTEEKDINLLHHHMQRLRESLIAHGGSLNQDLTELVQKAADQYPGALPAKLRLVVTWNGQARVEISPLEEWPDELEVALQLNAVRSKDQTLQHKTTWRGPYVRAANANPTAFECLLANEKGEVTEFTRGNAEFLLRDEWVTPPVVSGLLNGIARRERLRQGECIEKTVTLADLAEVTAVRFVSSVRGVVPVKIKPLEGVLLHSLIQSPSSPTPTQ